MLSPGEPLLVKSEPRMSETAENKTRLPWVEPSLELTAQITYGILYTVGTFDATGSVATESATAAQALHHSTGQPVPAFRFPLTRTNLPHILGCGTPSCFELWFGRCAWSACDSLWLGIPLALRSPAHGLPRKPMNPSKGIGRLPDSPEALSARVGHASAPATVKPSTLISKGGLSWSS